MATPLLELIASVMEAQPSEVDEHSSSETLGTWDSMRQIMLATILESEYGFTLTTAEMEQLGSVASIRTVLAAHGVTDA